MSQALKAQEPSMEEILASIRRIIADDEATKPAAVRTEPAALRPLLSESTRRTGSSPIPSTHDMMEAFEPRVEAPRVELPRTEPLRVEPLRAEPRFSAPSYAAHEPAAKEEVPAIDPLDALEAEIAATAMGRPDHDEPLVIEPAPAYSEPPREESVSVAASEPALLSPQTSDAVNSAFSALAHTMLAHNTERLDDMARQMLRPMLKAWLDDNLPTIVERLVRGEIERVARGR